MPAPATGAGILRIAARRSLRLFSRLATLVADLIESGLLPGVDGLLCRFLCRQAGDLAVDLSQLCLVLCQGLLCAGRSESRPPFDGGKAQGAEQQ